MRRVVIENVQKGASPWLPVIAGIGGALIVAVVSYLVARQQRQADTERLDREHLRDVLRPAIEYLLEPTAISALIPRVDLAMTKPSGERKKSVQSFVDELHTRWNHLVKEFLGLAVVLDVNGVILRRLDRVTDVIQEARDLLNAWAEDGVADPEFRETLKSLSEQEADAAESFVVAVYTMIGCRVPEPRDVWPADLTASSSPGAD